MTMTSVMTSVKKTTKNRVNMHLIASNFMCIHFDSFDSFWLSCARDLLWETIFKPCSKMYFMDTNLGFFKKLLC